MLSYTEMTCDHYYHHLHQVEAHERASGGYHAGKSGGRGYHASERIDRGYHAGGGRIKDPRGPLGFFATTLRLLSYLVLIFSMIISLDVD